MADRKETGARPPTARQLEVLAVIAAQTRLRGFPPTYREIAAPLGIKSASQTITDHIGLIETKGLIARDWGTDGCGSGKRRALRITDAGHAALAARRWQFIPIVRESGKAYAAGKPRPECERI